MKYLFLTLVLMGTPSMSNSQTNIIAIYGDSTHSDCNIPYEMVMRAYVFHYSSSGATGSSFQAPWQSCFVEIEFVCDERVFPITSGTSQTGVSIEYGACLTGWIHILTVLYVDYSGLGFPACCELPVLPHPNSSSGALEILDCAGSVNSATGVSGIAKADASCPCEIPSGIAESGATWGKIKELYRKSDS